MVAKGSWAPTILTNKKTSRPSAEEGQIVETDGTATPILSSTLPPAPFYTVSSAATAPSRSSDIRRDSKGLRGICNGGKQAARVDSTHDLGLPSGAASLARGEVVDDQQPRFIAVENAIDFPAVSSRIPPLQESSPSSKSKPVKGGPEKRFVSASSSSPASGAGRVPMPTTRASLDVPCASRGWILSGYRLKRGWRDVRLLSSSLPPIPNPRTILLHRGRRRVRGGRLAQTDRKSVV